MNNNKLLIDEIDDIIVTKQIEFNNNINPFIFLNETYNNRNKQLLEELRGIFNNEKTNDINCSWLKSSDGVLTCSNDNIVLQFSNEKKCNEFNSYCKNNEFEKYTTNLFKKKFNILGVNKSDIIIFKNNLLKKQHENNNTNIKEKIKEIWGI